MVIKGIIKTIDYNGNTCTVRLPLFESSSKNGEIILPAIISIQPGITNAYTEGDIVIVAFENNVIDTPVVIGKLYMGAVADSKVARGAINTTSLTVTQKASIPLNTELSFEGDNSTVVGVDGGTATYKTIADLVVALQKTTTQINNTSLDLDSQIAEIKVTYMETKHTDGLEPPLPNNPAWHAVMPVTKDGYYIWQKTTCYNRRNKILGTPEIICLSNLATTVSYLLSISARVHTGKTQSTKIKISPKKIINNEILINDQAFIRWSYVDDNESATVSKGEVELGLPLENKNILIEASIDENFNQIYDTEIITYSPLNTPILDLSNDNASLVYDTENNKIGEEIVYSTANLYLNGEILSGGEFEWSAIPENSCTFEQDGNTVNVSNIYSNTVILRCTVTEIPNYSNLTLIKDLSISKQIKGADGADGLPGPQGPQGISITKVTTEYILVDNDITDPNEVASLQGWSEESPSIEINKTIWKREKYTYSAEDSDLPQYSTPVPDVMSTTVYALAQGKTTNYYSDEDPAIIKDVDGNSIESRYGELIKKGDCWFATSSITEYFSGEETENNDITKQYSFKTLPKTTKKIETVKDLYEFYISVGQDEYLQISKDNLTYRGGTDLFVSYNNMSYSISYHIGQIQPDSTPLEDKNLIDLDIEQIYMQSITPQTLRQWDGSQWQDIGGELVANKVTANFINALDITAKKITILSNNTNKDIIFSADGTNEEGKVTIGGFEVNETGLSHGNSALDKNCVLISSDSNDLNEDLFEISSVWPSNVGGWHRDSSKDRVKDGVAQICYVADHSISSEVNKTIYVMRVTSTEYWDLEEDTEFTLGIAYKGDKGGVVYTLPQNYAPKNWDDLLSNMHNSSYYVENSTQLSSKDKNAVPNGNFIWVIFKPDPNTESDCQAVLWIDKPKVQLVSCTDDDIIDLKDGDFIVNPDPFIRYIEKDIIGITSQNSKQSHWATYTDPALFSHDISLSNNRNRVCCSKLIFGANMDEFTFYAGGGDEKNFILVSNINAEQIPYIDWQYERPMGRDYIHTNTSDEGNKWLVDDGMISGHKITLTGVKANDYVYITHFVADTINYWPNTDNWTLHSICMPEYGFILSTPNIYTEANQLVYEPRYNKNNNQCYRLFNGSSASDTVVLKLKTKKEIKKLTIGARLPYENNYFTEPHMAWDIPPCNVYFATSQIINENTGLAWPDHTLPIHIDTDTAKNSLNTAYFHNRKTIWPANKYAYMGESIYDKINYTNIPKDSIIYISYISQKKDFDSVDDSKTDFDPQMDFQIGPYISIKASNTSNLFAPTTTFYELTFGGEDYNSPFSYISKEQTSELFKETVENFNKDTNSFIDIDSASLLKITEYGNNYATLTFKRDLDSYTFYIYCDEECLCPLAVSTVNYPDYFNPFASQTNLYVEETPTTNTKKPNKHMLAHTDTISTTDETNGDTNKGKLIPVVLTNVKKDDYVIIVSKYDENNPVGPEGEAFLLLPNRPDNTTPVVIQVGQQFGVTNYGKVIATEAEIGNINLSEDELIIGKKQSFTDNFNPGVFISKEGITTSNLLITPSSDGTGLTNYYRPILTPINKNGEFIYFCISIYSLWLGPGKTITEYYSDLIDKGVYIDLYNVFLPLHLENKVKITPDSVSKSLHFENLTDEYISGDLLLVYKEM